MLKPLLDVLADLTRDLERRRWPQAAAAASADGCGARYRATHLRAPRTFGQRSAHGRSPDRVEITPKRHRNFSGRNCQTDAKAAVGIDIQADRASIAKYPDAGGIQRENATLSRAGCATGDDESQVVRERRSPLDRGGETIAARLAGAGW